MPHVSFTEKAFTIDGREVFIMSGEMHYFRIPEGLWRDRLLKLRRCFFNTVASYIPWNWHEERRGVFRLSGSRDLPRYLSLAGELGLYFIARPGPYICAEWDNGGLPPWLTAKLRKARTLDPGFMESVRRWYGFILPAIRGHLATRGGNIVMVQVENEYFWGNVPYILELYEAARELGVDVPVVTNEDRYVRGTQVVDTLDSYPAPWDAQGLERIRAKVEELERQQPGKPLMYMELEGGWYSTIGRPLPTERGEFPGDWTEFLVKYVMALGVTAINIYMFHGGTNPGYWASKYVTSTYDYHAAISEWGGLTEKYFRLRRIGGLTHFFNELLATASPDKGVKLVSGDVALFPRRGRGGGFVFLVNWGGVKRVRLEVDGRAVPSRGELVVPARYVKVVPYRLRLGGVELLYSTSEVLAAYESGGVWVVILYGQPGERCELALSGTGYRVSGAEAVETAGSTVISFNHVPEDTVVEIRGPTAIDVVATTRERAEKTWFIETGRGLVAVVSNIYFMGEAGERERGVEAEAVLEPGEPIDLTIHAPFKLEDAALGGELVLRQVGERVYKAVGLPVEAPVPVDKPPLEWKLREIAFDSLHGWVKAKPYQPLELLGFLENGYYVYRIRFRCPNAANGKILFSRVADYASVYLNGAWLGDGYEALELEAGESLPDPCEITVVVEATGRSKNGLTPSLNGVFGGIYVGELETDDLPAWSKAREFSLRLLMEPGIPAAVDLAELLTNPGKYLDVDRLPPAPSSEGPGLYETSLEIRDEWLKGEILLELRGLRGRAILYVNRAPLGLVEAGRAGRAVVDVTRYVKPGVNKVSLLAIGGRPGPARVLVYQHRVEGEWRVARVSPEELMRGGRRLGSVQLPYVCGKEGRVFVLEGTMNVDFNDGVEAPVKLIVNGDFRGLIYVNGRLIGRHYPEGPQGSYYVPESLLRPSGNRVAIVIPEGRGRVDWVEVDRYHVKVREVLKLIG